MSPDNDTVTAKPQNVQHQHLMCDLVLCRQRGVRREGWRGGAGTLTERKRERKREGEEPRVENRGVQQRWEQLKCQYYGTVLKCVFQVSVVSVKYFLFLPTLVRFGLAI